MSYIDEHQSDSSSEHPSCLAGALRIDSMSSTQTFATANDVGPAVSVITWFLGVAVVLFVVARLATKLYLAQSLGLDDSLIITATVSTMSNCSKRHALTRAISSSVSVWSQRYLSRRRMGWASKKENCCPGSFRLSKRHFHKSATRFFCI